MKKLIFILGILFYAGGITAQGKFFGGDASGYASILIPNQTLPLYQLQLSAEVKGTGILLKWPDEIDWCKEITIEKTKDIYSFNVLESGEIQQFSKAEFLDEYPFLGKNYYRVRAKNDEFEIISDIISVIWDSSNRQIILYPNPTESLIHLESNGISPLRIFDATGNLIEHYDRVPTSVDLSNFLPGVYLFDFLNETIRVIRL